MEEIIRKLLKEKGLKMADLAVRVGMTQSNLLASIKKNPKLSTLEDICEALGIELSDLFASDSSDKVEGIMVVNGQTFAIAKPRKSMVQIPVYNDYKILRSDVKRFIHQCIEEKKMASMCGMVEALEYFTLTYDYDAEIGNQSIYDKFILTLCYSDGKIYTTSYGVYEECKINDIEKWDEDGVIQSIQNDIEGIVIGTLGIQKDSLIDTTE